MKNTIVPLNAYEPNDQNNKLTYTTEDIFKLLSKVKGVKPIQHTPYLAEKPCLAIKCKTAGIGAKAIVDVITKDFPNTISDDPRDLSHQLGVVLSNLDFDYDEEDEGVIVFFQSLTFNE